MRNKLIKLAGSTIVAVAMASIALTAMPQAALAAPAAEKATGSIVMGADGQDHNEKQAINFNVFERDTNKGNVTYTNFQYADEGSGVWAFGDAAFDVSFEYAGLCQGACVHTLQVTDFQPLSPTSLSFEGTGFYASNPTWTETFTGTIVGNKITLTLDADDDGALYQWNHDDAQWDDHAARLDQRLRGTTTSLVVARSRSHPVPCPRCSRSRPR